MPDFIATQDHKLMVPKHYKSLLTNGSIEAPLAGTVNAFDDQFADLNAWTVDTGSAWAVAANVITPPSTGAERLKAGHPEWWDWSAGSRIRFQWKTGGEFSWYMRFVDGSNYVRIYTPGTSLNLQKVIGGSPTVLSSVAVTLVNNNWYWFQATVVGTTFTVGLYDDSAGAVGAQISTDRVGVASDSIVQTGQMAVQSISAAMPVGGAFADVCLVKIPAPPNWATTVATGVPAFCASKTTFLSGVYSLSVFNKHNLAVGYWDSPTFTTVSAIYGISARAKQTTGVIGGGGFSGALIREGFSADPQATMGDSNAHDWTVLSARANPGAGGGRHVRVGLAAWSGTAWFDNIWFAQGTFIPKSNFR